MSPQSRLRLPRCTGCQHLSPATQESREIVRKDGNLPARTGRQCKGKSRVFQPALVQKINVAVRQAAPYQARDRIDSQSNWIAHGLFRYRVFKSKQSIGVILVRHAHQGPSIASPTAASNSSRVNGLGRTFPTCNRWAASMDPPSPRRKRADNARIGAEYAASRGPMVVPAQLGSEMSAMTSCGLTTSVPMVFCRDDDSIARFAEPALEQLPNKVVRFDDYDTALRAHDFPCGMRRLDARPVNAQRSFDPRCHSAICLRPARQMTTDTLAGPA